MECTLTTGYLLDAFPSSTAFDLINSSLQSNEADRKDAIKKGGAIFAFTLKNNGQEESWYIDLKEKGVVGKGAAPPGGKANGMPESSCAILQTRYLDRGYQKYNR